MDTEPIKQLAGRQLKFSSAVFVLVVAAVVGGTTVLAVYQRVSKEIDQVASEIYQPASNTTTSTTVRTKPQPQVAKGLYLTAYSANTAKKLDEIISLINTTELNAIVIDIKDYSGYVLFDTKNDLAKQFKLIDNRYTDLAATVKKLHDHHIYVIARQTVFQDPVLAKANPDWAIKSKQGGVWRDHKGLLWVDATRQEVWKYNVALAKEAITYGFDEINFDYVRFPSDGNMNDVVYSVPDKKRYEIMSSFYSFLGRQLVDEPAYISLDMFGFVMERRGEDDLNIGQRLVDAVGKVDYISPMMYPSHYPSGHLGLANPAANPARVFENGMQKGAPYFASTTTKVRPWIQAFNIGAEYGAENIRQQIDVIEKYPNQGWLMWNAANRYSAAGLKKE